MKSGLVIALILFSLNCIAQADRDELLCTDIAFPAKVKDFFSDNQKIIKAVCNQDLTKIALARLKYAHLCRDIKLDPSLVTKVQKNLYCDLRLKRIEYPLECKPYLEEETKKLLSIHEKLSRLEKDQSPEELHNDLLTIYLNRLVANGERTPGRGSLNSYVFNNIPAIVGGLAAENGYDFTTKSKYLVCVEQALRFFENDQPEANYLRMKGYTLDFFDETDKKDKGDQSKHAFVMITSPDGKKYGFDSWKGETKPLTEEMFTQVRGLTKPQFKKQPLKVIRISD